MDNKIHKVHEAMREKNKLLYKREHEHAKKEQQTIENDMEFLGKIDQKFDPLESYF